jgi:hypothetical protein
MPIITGADLGAHLGIPDAQDDASLTRAAGSASSQIAAWCDNGGFDKTAIVSASARVFHPTSEYECVVDDFWELTALAVATDEADSGTYSTTWTITTDFTLEPLNGRKHGQTWSYSKIKATGSRLFPCSLQNRATVQVTAAWGWATYPDPVVEAALIQASRIFRRKNSPEGVLGGFDQFGAVRVSTRIDPDVAALLSPYQRASAFGII